ncbi:hypothetical protein FOXYSP1_12641 [Fusarium oxysporum f. sp. phaseoli]
MLHGSRYWRLSVAHPGSVNLDVGALLHCTPVMVGCDLVRHRSPVDYDTWFPVPEPSDGPFSCPFLWLVLIRLALHLLFRAALYHLQLVHPKLVCTRPICLLGHVVKRNVPIFGTQVLPYP